MRKFPALALQTELAAARFALPTLEAPHVSCLTCGSFASSDCYSVRVEHALVVLSSSTRATKKKMSLGVRLPNDDLRLEQTTTLIAKHTNLAFAVHRSLPTQG